MTSDPKHTQAYVWTWLPGYTQPVVAGRLTPSGQQLILGAPELPCAKGCHWLNKIGDYIRGQFQYIGVYRTGLDDRSGQ
jgi:hypothetical protein